MKIEDKLFGTSFDNKFTPVHNWYKFTAGYSYKFIEYIIKEEKLQSGNKIYDPFAGCGTTLVTSQKNKIAAVGNEAQKFMYDIIRAKLNWNIRVDIIISYIKEIESKIDRHKFRHSVIEIPHELLSDLYSFNKLNNLILIRNFIENIKDQEKYYLFLKLALSQTLHFVSKYPIATPYISRNKRNHNRYFAFTIFKKIVLKMLNDLNDFKHFEKTSKVYYHDSRKKNIYLNRNMFDVCLTSPPYLNNLDYGEVSKVHNYFYENVKNWNEITKYIRKNLVTSATTHYSPSDLIIEDWKESDFYINNHNVGDYLINKSNKIRKISKTKSGKKSFDILTLFYFQDMYKVLLETKRVLKKNAKAFFILGDSAPYGVFIPTTKLLGEIAINTGFSKFQIFKIRDRGNKWQNLKNRHYVPLTENLLVIQ